MEFFKDIGAFAGTALTIITLLGIIIKPIRTKFVEWLRQSSTQDEALRALLSVQITNIYFQYLSAKSIPAEILQNLMDMYEVYKRLNGNHYIDRIYSEMVNEWEIVPPVYPLKDNRRK